MYWNDDCIISDADPETWWLMRVRPTSKGGYAWDVPEIDPRQRWNQLAKDDVLDAPGNVIGKEGINTLKIIFERKPGTAASAAIDVSFYGVTDGFSECEDSKVCLGRSGLGSDFWETQEAKDIRMSSHLQYLCLQNGLVNPEDVRGLNINHKKVVHVFTCQAVRKGDTGLQEVDNVSQGKGWRVYTPC